MAPLTRDGSADEMEGGTFFLGCFDFLVFGSRRRRCPVQHAQHSATVLRFRLSQGDREDGFYHVEAVAETSQGLHEHPHRDR